MKLQTLLLNFEDSEKKMQRFLFHFFNRKRSLTSIVRDNSMTKQLKLL